MNLKEAFQAQNKINNLLEYIIDYLNDDNNIMTITEKHLKSKAVNGQQDETIDCEDQKEEDFDINKLVVIYQKLMKEKEVLSNSIAKAKEKMDFNLDSAVDLNKSCHSFITTLKYMASKKSSHKLQKGAGKGYIINNEGTPTSYSYDVDKIMTINYDRNKIKNIITELNLKSNQISQKIDKLLIETEVDYIPSFDINTDKKLIIEELIEK